jgi:hypothetical protein
LAKNEHWDSAVGHHLHHRADERQVRAKSWRMHMPLTVQPLPLPITMPHTVLLPFTVHLQPQRLTHAPPPRAARSAAGRPHQAAHRMC